MKQTDSTATAYRLNRRLLLAAVIGVVALAAGIHLLHGRQVQRSSEQLLLDARAAQKAGEIERAVHLYTQFLSYRPHHVDAAAELGFLTEQHASSATVLRQVYVRFEDVLRREPQRMDVRLRIAEVYARLGRFHDALKHLAVLEAAEKKQDGPRDAKVAFLRGQCQEGLREFGRAAQSYAEAVLLDPETIDYYTRLCSLLIRRSEDVPATVVDSIVGAEEASESTRDAAERLMDVAVRRGRPEFRAYLARATYFKSRGQLDLAGQDVQRAVGLAGEQPEVLYVAAELALQQASSVQHDLTTAAQAEKYLEAAAEYARTGLAQTPPDPRFYLVQARVELARGKHDVAIKLLEEGLSWFPKTYENAEPSDFKRLADAERRLAFCLADRLIHSDENSRAASGEQGNPRVTEQVDGLMRRLDKRGMPPEFIAFLQAQQKLVREQWHEAAVQLYSIQRNVGAEDDLIRRVCFDLKTCYERMGNPDAKRNVLREAVDYDPLWDEARLELAHALTELNQYDEAIERYLPLLKLPEVPGQVVRLMTLKEMSLAENRRNWVKIEEVFEKALEAGADPVRIEVLRAETRLHQKQYTEAEELLKAAEERSPQEVSVRVAQLLLTVYREDIGRQERLERGREILERAAQEFGRDLKLEMARIQLILLEPAEQALADLADLESTAGEFEPDARRELLNRLARAYEALEAGEQADAVWTRLTREFPNEMDHWFAMAARGIQNRDPEQFQQVLAEVRRIEGAGGPNGNYLEAADLLEQVTAGGSDHREGLERSRRLLRASAEQRPNWVAVPRLQGRLEELAGSRVEALSFYEKAMEMGDRLPETMVRRLHLLAEMGRDEEVVELTLKVGLERPEFLVGDVGRIARTLAVQRQDLDRAYQYAETLASNSEDFWDVVWFAELRYQRGERGPEIDEAFQKGVTLAPEEPESWLALVRHLTRSGRLLDAQSVLKQVPKQRGFPQESVPLTMARGYEILGMYDRAEEFYLQAVDAETRGVAYNIVSLKAVADFYRRRGRLDDSETYLQKIIDSQSEAADADIAWARRNHALITAARGGYDRSIEAIDILERNSSAGETLSDLRVKAALLARRPTRRDREAAIKVFEAIRRRDPDSKLPPDEQRQLAELYEAVRNWSQARREYARLVETDNPAPSHVALYVQALLRHDEIPEAGSWMRKLIEIAPELYVTTKTHARFLHATGKGPEAATRLATWLEQHRPEPLPSWFAGLLKSDRLAAELETRLGDPEPLHALVREALSQALESLQKGGGGADEAAAMLRQRLFTHELELAHHTTAIHEAAVICEEIDQLQAAEELLREYAARSNRADAPFSLAKFLSRRGRMDEALDVCEATHGKCDPEVFASAVVSVVGRSSIIGGGNITPERMKQVEQWVESILADNPTSPTCVVALADLRLMQRRLDDAESLYRRLLPENDRHVIALNNLAWLLAFQRRNSDEALQRINRAIEIAGPRPDLLDTRAIIYMNKNLPDLAISDLNAALEDTPFAVGYLHLAQAYALGRDVDEASRMRQKALEHGLSPERLHPLERQRYEELEEILKRHALVSST